MLNVPDYIVNHPNVFKQFKVDELLFVEYHCIVEEVMKGAWTHNNYFSYTLKGKKGIKTLQNEYYVNSGDAIFIKKGAYTGHQFFEEEYCSLMIFVPDEFIKRVILDHQIKCKVDAKVKHKDNVIPVEMDEVLSSYFHSVLSYFSQQEAPSEKLLKVKFEELIINIACGSKNQLLANYFNDLCTNNKIPIRDIMEANFAYNMKLGEFARLSGRSISAFCRDFRKIYNTSPGKWLTYRRLEYGKYLLETTDKSINEITFDIGFENPSHFIRIFKKRFGVSPLRFKHSIV